MSAVVLPSDSVEWEAINTALSSLVCDAAENAKFWIGQGDIVQTSRDRLVLERSAADVLAGMLGLNVMARLPHYAGKIALIDEAIALPAPSEREG